LPAPGGDPGQTYANFGFEAVTFIGGVFLNDAGQVAFENAFLFGGPGVTSANDSAIWGPGAGGALTLLAREGGAVPGGPPGALFTTASLPSPLVFASLSLGDSGRVAFRAPLQIGPGGVTSATNVGIWASDGGGSFLARGGDPAPGVAGGSFATNFGSPVQSDAGIAFSAGLAGGGSGIWAPDGAGGQAPVALAGDAAPGTSGAVFGSLAGLRLSLDDFGRVAFAASLAPGSGGVTTANDRGL
jgi:hypothetical protein